MSLPLADRWISDEVARRVERLDIRTNDFGFDRWGVSSKATRRALAVAWWFYRHYFRVETLGLEHVPAGRSLLIGNHSGQLPFDGVLVGTALAMEAEPPRFARAMIEKFFATPPWLNVWMARVGQLIGLPENAERLLLEEDAVVLVFPEGARGSGRVWRDRYKILGFGHGFMRLALRTRTPIVPFGLVGAEEACLSFSRLAPLARLLGTPYLPLSPQLIPLPLPTKIHIRIGAPMHFEGRGDEDDADIDMMVAEVEARCASLMQEGLAARRGIFR